MRREYNGTVSKRCGSCVSVMQKATVKTEYLQFNAKDLTLAGELIRQGKLVAFPTETVYGLGANALDETAVKSTYLAKGRPSDNPLIVHIWDKSQIDRIALGVSPDAQKLVDVFMPGSLTVVLPKRRVIPDCVTAGLDTVAVRMPASEEARRFLQFCDVPVAAPSANTSTRPSPTTWQAVKEDMDEKISAVLCGRPCQVGIESTVVDCTGATPLVLRPGVVTPQMLSGVLGKDVPVVTNPAAKVNSPGVKYKHYAPKVPMYLDISGDELKLKDFYAEMALKGLNPVLLTERPERFENFNVYPIGTTDEEVAQNLFENLRFLEKRYGCIIASFSSKTEFAQSILNRLVKSASHNLI
ncbi:MAG: L-threonylcarbamoyladenylate synthase [Corallococcus sp.]|nr:L-threonylcarbamoyladenylate synthase [Corallococcus sp.]MCM1359391.1 L-threonylcarbamoyladenylate synthase [Corallococcus sp.]MCM1394834.1 L-threonylcarbamoyladenylate synthase [Corallococcus sp.]